LGTDQVLNIARDHHWLAPMHENLDCV